MRPARSLWRVLLGALILTGAGVALAVAAWAQTPPTTTIPPQHGPATATIADPVPGYTPPQAAPHGGYSTGTNFCLQCHSVHEATGSYALMYQASVTATCKTCHSVLRAGGTSPRDTQLFDGNPTGTVGTASKRAAYDVPNPTSSHPLGELGIDGHTLTEHGGTIGIAPTEHGGTSAAVTTTTVAGKTPPALGANSTDAAAAGTYSDVSGGLYCGSCHSPHGDAGQIVNYRWNQAPASPGPYLEGDLFAGTRNDEGLELNFTEVTAVTPTITTSSRNLWLHYDSTSTSWQGCPYDDLVDSTGAAVLASTRKHLDPGDRLHVNGSCEAYNGIRVLDAESQVVSLAGYKLLSAYPNHTYSLRKSYNTQRSSRDTAAWCSSCHTTKQPEFATGAYHNHPTGCLSCHGNPANIGTDGKLTYAATSADFPHSSTNDNLLKAYPDGLCMSCHGGGGLP